MRLFVSDLDGTLYKDGQQLSAGCNRENRQAILKWIKHGNAFAIATARGLDYYETLCEELGIRLNYIGSNGAQMIFADGEILIRKIKARYFLELCDYVRQNDLDATVMMDYKGSWLNSGGDRYPFRGKKQIWQSLKRSRAARMDEIDPFDEVAKIGMVIRPDLRDPIKEKLRKIYHKQMELVSSDFDNIDFGPYDCSKGQGVMELAKRYHLRTTEIAVIGDSENDISMMRKVQNSYCMSHAEKNVKKEAGTVVGSVAEAIDRELAKKEG